MSLTFADHVVWKGAAASSQAAPMLRDTLLAVEGFIRKYVILIEHQAVVISLWVAHSHALAAADATPYIHVSSPEPECGKTRLLEMLTPIVARPWMTAYTTKATLVRKGEPPRPDPACRCRVAPVQFVALRESALSGGAGTAGEPAREVSHPDTSRMKKPLDPVTRYATDVVQGRIVAGRLVWLACQRHLHDLAHQAEKGLVWKQAEAQRVIDFFADVLCLPEETAAEETIDAVLMDGSPFVLQPFQQFMAGALIGWYTTKGYRRFRDAYVETAKGSGKTPWGAGMLLYLLVADGERGAQCYFAAATMAQAKEAGMTDAVKMVQASPHLCALIDQKVNNLAVLDSGSFLRAISSEKRGLDGKRVHGAFIDEEHEHATSAVVSKVRRGTKGRRNALVIRATNSGFDRLSVCWHDHEYSRRVLDGTLTDDAWFAYVCGLDPCESCRARGNLFPVDECPACDDWRTEGPHWLKANPNLGVSLSWQYLRELVKQAVGRPEAVSDLLRFNFCVWTQARVQAWDMGKWRTCGSLTVADADLVGKPCFGGLDLGQNDDFAAWARLWDLGAVCVIKVRFWLPRVALTTYPHRPYADWERAGLLVVTEGDTTDLDLIEEAVLNDARTDGILEIAYDKRFANQLALHLQGAGLTMIDTPQGYALNESIKSVSKLIADVALAHGNHLIMGWMMDNSVLRHGRNKEVRLDKDATKEKIDGPSALVMANARRIAQLVAPPSMYDDPNFDPQSVWI